MATREIAERYPGGVSALLNPSKGESADLSRDDFLPRIAQVTEGLDVNLLVNNAGLAFSADFLTNELNAELGMLHLNSRASLILTHHFGSLMRSRRARGHHLSCLRRWGDGGSVVEQLRGDQGAQPVVR